MNAQRSDPDPLTEAYNTVVSVFATSRFSELETRWNDTFLGIWEFEEEAAKIALQYLAIWQEQQRPPRPDEFGQLVEFCISSMTRQNAPKPPTSDVLATSLSVQRSMMQWQTEHRPPTRGELAFVLTECLSTGVHWDCLQSLMLAQSRVT